MNCYLITMKLSTLMVVGETLRTARKLTPRCDEYKGAISGA
jgi:hypothetical protein